MIYKLLPQDPVSHLKENRLRVIPLNLSLEMQEMESRQEVLLKMNVFYISFLSQEEPKKVEETLQDVDWVLPMQEELNHFKKKQSVKAGAQALK